MTYLKTIQIAPAFARRGVDGDEMVELPFLARIRI